MKKKLIGFIPDFEESKQIVIAKGKTMKEAIKFAKKMYGFNGDTMEKVRSKKDTRIGVMKKIIGKSVNCLFLAIINIFF